jgi:filamentous hemagglutinin family protein
MQYSIFDWYFVSTLDYIDLYAQSSLNNSFWDNGFVEVSNSSILLEYALYSEPQKDKADAINIAAKVDEFIAEVLNDAKAQPHTNPVYQPKLIIKDINNLLQSKWYIASNNAEEVILVGAKDGKKTTLNNLISIQGNKVSLIISDPDGIECEGCSFENVADILLTAEEFENIGIDGNVKFKSDLKGNVQIKEQGLKAKNYNLTLKGKKLFIHGSVQGVNQLTLEPGIGENGINIEASQNSCINVNSLIIKSTQPGVILFAGNVSSIFSEIASNGNITLGNDLKETLFEVTSLTIVANGEIINNKLSTLKAQQEVYIQAQNHNIKNEGKIELSSALNAVSIETHIIGNDIINFGSITSNHLLVVKAANDFDGRGGYLNLNAAASIESGNFIYTGNVDAKHNLFLKCPKNMRIISTENDWAKYFYANKELVIITTNLELRASNVKNLKLGNTFKLIYYNCYDHINNLIKDKCTKALTLYLDTWMPTIPGDFYFIGSRIESTLARDSHNDYNGPSNFIVGNFHAVIEKDLRNHGFITVLKDMYLESEQGGIVNWNGRIQIENKLICNQMAKLLSI